MKTIKLFSLINSINSASELFGETTYLELCKSFRFEWSEKDYDYLYVNQTIYTDTKMFKRFVNSKKNNPIIILLADEAFTPDLNLFDYALTFDDNITHSDRILNMTPVYLRPLIERLGPDGDKKITYQSKSMFCNFIYSNSLANPFRDNFFHELNKYKTVASLGNHLNNTNRKIRIKKNSKWEEESLRLRESFKFSIAFENTLMSGYTSEKIVNSLLSGTIPIYWGNPSISKLINPDCFINCHEFTDIQSIINRIKQIDSDENLYKKILNAPWMSLEQYNNVLDIESKKISFWADIFQQDKGKCSRTPDGTWIYAYNYWFDRKFLYNRFLWKARFLRILLNFK